MSVAGVIKSVAIVSIVGVALSGAMAASAVSNGETVPVTEEEPVVQATRGFDLINGSSFTFELKSVRSVYGSDENEFPEAGSLLVPGGTLHFEAKIFAPYIGVPAIVASFSALGTDPEVGKLIVSMGATGWSRTYEVSSSIVDGKRHLGEIRLSDKQRA